LLRIADEAVAMGIPEVILTGGEPRAHPDWAQVARRLREGGVAVELFTAGVQLDSADLDAICAAGVRALRVSLEGRGPAHDARRPSAWGSGFLSTVAGIERALARGLGLTVVTTVGEDTLAELPHLAALLRQLGVRRWSVQLRSSGGAEPGDVLDREGIAAVVAFLQSLPRGPGALYAPLHCSIGYGGPEEALREGGPWRGAPAGRSGMALTAEGGLLGCPCLPDEFVTGSAIETPLPELWRDDRRFVYSRGWSRDLLAGACANCRIATTCRSGCLGMAFRSSGAVGCQPLCLHADQWQLPQSS